MILPVNPSLQITQIYLSPITTIFCCKNHYQLHLTLEKGILSSRLFQLSVCIPQYLSQIYICKVTESTFAESVILDSVILQVTIRQLCRNGFLPNRPTFDIIHLQFTSRKYLLLPTLFPKGLNETRLVFSRISPYVARAKSNSIKPRRKSYKVRTLTPSIHSRVFESCSSFYFPLP